MPNRLDYQPPDFTIDRVDLTFDIQAQSVAVRSLLQVRRLNPEPSLNLRLDGIDLSLDGIALNGRALDPAHWRLDAESLTLLAPPERFQLDLLSTLHPAQNLSCEGLYASGASLLTQCEAEGFRRITWFLDRPDVLARFTTTILAERAAYPVLLSNGNLLEAGLLDGDRHMVRFEDPHPKPCYLFALVAGDLAAFEGEYTTQEGRFVRLRVFTAPNETARGAHALAALKSAMRWDEEHFGLSYDLDEFNIVATHDFNMGAMENKGLNIFNASVVLADQDIATDDDLDVIEAVVAHEYFHNWTGNRVTCRDWFQLTLKEGLTVYRDQEFMASHPDGRAGAELSRLDHVERLTRLQFAEDAGALSHPIRPESYSEINNFYTLTIYEKGAEVVRLYQTLLGRDGFRRGMDLYFQRHDGQAVTCDDFRAAMADANGADLDTMARWYSQAGTPQVEIEIARTGADLALNLTQYPHGEPLPIPLRYRLLGPDGLPLGEPAMVVLNELHMRVDLGQVPAGAVVSMLRGFSAPVLLKLKRSRSDLIILALHDDDPWARADAIRTLEKNALGAHMDGQLEQADDWLGAVLEVQRLLLASDAHLGFAARLLKPLDESLLDPAEGQIKLDACAAAFDWFSARRRSELSTLAGTRLLELNARLGGPYQRHDAALRALRAVLLHLSAFSEETQQHASALLQQADNLSDRLCALKTLLRGGGSDVEQALAGFAERWKHEPLVLNKWFALQAGSPERGTPEALNLLLQHPLFTLKNPNRARSVLGVFARDNRRQFHRIDGRGYALLADAIAELDAFNPQIAARLCEPFGVCARLDDARRQTLTDTLVELRGKVSSNNVCELLAKALA